MFCVLGLVYICLHVKQAKPSSRPSSFLWFHPKRCLCFLTFVYGDGDGDGKAYSVGTLAILLWWFLPCMRNWLWVLCPWHHYLGGHDGNVQRSSSSLLSLSLSHIDSPSCTSKGFMMFALIDGGTGDLDGGLGA